LETTKLMNCNQKDAKAAEQRTLLHRGRTAKPILQPKKRAEDENQTDTNWKINSAQETLPAPPALYRNRRSGVSAKANTRKPEQANKSVALAKSFAEEKSGWGYAD
jgi:hypothetical protein